MMMEGKDGGDRGEGSGHRSLSQLTRPCGAAVSLSLSVPPSETPPHPERLPASLIPPSVGTEGEGSVGELSVAVHFTAVVRRLGEVDAGGGGGGGDPPEKWISHIRNELRASH